MEFLNIDNFSFAYPGQEQAALRGVSLTVERGEFLVLCGPSGCGKSTLLRQLKPAIAPHGERLGQILLDGQPLESLSQADSSRRIGFVQQNVDNQLVTDKVWHELAFGLESLGYETPVIRRRVAEMASFFGIEDWFYRDVASLSGGQKQMLNLASVMVMQPDLLILDEPTSQLDPIAASEFLSVLGKINRELGTTVRSASTAWRRRSRSAPARRCSIMGHCSAPGNRRRLEKRCAPLATTCSSQCRRRCAFGVRLIPARPARCLSAKDGTGWKRMLHHTRSARSRPSRQPPCRRRRRSLERNSGSATRRTARTWCAA